VSGTDRDLCALSLVELAGMLERGETSAIAATEAVLDRIELLEPSLNAFATVTGDRALARARELDELHRRGGRVGPLHGVPVTVKDNLPLAGVPTTAGSPLLRDWVPETSALAVARLEAAGAIVVGKTNLWEFAYGAPSTLAGRAVNPWNAERTTGASSSGSAVAVAACLGAASLGTDSGGSVRIPASFCGVVGMKPSYGLLPTGGVIPVSITLDHVGVLARAAGDVTAVLAAMVRLERMPAEAGRTRLARVRSDALKPLSHGTATVLDAAIDLMGAAGAVVEEVTIPDLDEGCSVKWTISGFEAAHYHRERFGPPSDSYAAGVRRLLEQGQDIRADEYERALTRRDELRAALEAALTGFDALVLPATPMSAPPVDAEVGETLLATTRCTALFNVTGAPALVVPAGIDGDGLPVGLQLVGRIGSDAALLRLGVAFEERRGPLPPPPAVGALENLAMAEPGRAG